MKVEILDENSNKYRRVRRALFGDETGRIKTFAIISPENPLGWKNSTDEQLKQKYLKWLENKGAYNKEQLLKLEATLMADRLPKTNPKSALAKVAKQLRQSGDECLKYGHFNYVEIKGKYGSLEHTLMIFNIPLDDAKAIASDFGQLSFFYGITNINNAVDGITTSILHYYKTLNCCKTYGLVEASNDIKFVDDAADFFSKFGFKFRISMKEFGDEEVKSIINDAEFDESMDCNGTFMSRALHRLEALEE